MAISNTQRILDLVACDASYQSGYIRSLLTTYPDSDPAAEVIPPESVFSGLNYITTSINGQTAYEFTGWQRAASHSDPGTGFAMVIYQNADKSEAIVAFTGTNGPDIQDWYSNLHLGKTQWEKNKDFVLEKLSRLEGAGGTPFNGKLHFTGQSLGGALAQYALFDYADNRRLQGGFDPSKVDLVTFNALGATEGLKQMRGGVYDQVMGSLATVDTIHYMTQNDVVHRLGGGHINGANSLLLKNTYFQAGEDILDEFNNVVGTAPGFYRQGGIAETHRIETGFYGFFQDNPAGLSAAVPYQVSYLDEEAGRAIGAAFANFLNNNDHPPAESWPRTIAAIASALAAAPPEKLESLFREFAKHLLASSQHPHAAHWEIALDVLPAAFAMVAAHPAIKKTLITAAMVNLSIAIGMDAGRSAADLLSEAASRMPAIIDEGLRDALLATQSTMEAALKIVFTAQAFTNDLPGESDWMQQALEIDGGSFNSALADADWQEKTVAYLTQAAQEQGNDPGKVYAGLWDAMLATSMELSSDATSTAFLERMKAEISEGMIKTARSISNILTDLTKKFTDTAGNWAGQVTRSVVDKFVDALSSGTTTERSLMELEGWEEALQTLQTGAQVLVLRPGAGPNPFDAPDFDPEANPVAAGALRESGAQSFSLYLPYAVGEDGLKVKLQLTGAAAASFDVYRNGIRLASGAGEFELTLEEGQRSASFTLIALRDVDADETLGLSAQLLDAQGVPTHQSHLELNLAFDATVEEALNPGNTIVLQDPNPNDDPVGSVGSLGYGSWDVLGTANDDQVTGNSLSDRIDGAAGDDLLQGDWGDDELIGGVGADRLYGGFGNDRLYALSVTTLDAAIAAADTPAATPAKVDTLEGGAGDDILIGAAGNWLMGGGGADLLVGGGGDDLVRGDGLGAGSEGGIELGNIGLADGMRMHLDFDAGRRKYSQYVTFTQGGQTRAAGNLGDEAIDGAADTLLTGAGNDNAQGDAGDDTLVLGAGADWGFGGAGADTIDGGADDDVLFGDFNHDAGAPTGNESATEMLNFEGLHGAEHGNDLIDGGAGADTIWGNGGADTIEGGAGNDELHGDDDLTPGEYQKADLLLGGAGEDRIWGGGGGDEILGGAGADQILGDSAELDAQYHGNDRIFGGEGADTIWGNGGNDEIYGEADDDYLDGDNQELAGDKHGKDVIDGGEGADQLAGWGNDDTLYGGEGNDSLFGDDSGVGLAGAHHGMDVLDGGAGDDSLIGGGKADRLSGGEGVDNIRGDADGLAAADEGDDWLDGGNGDDVLAGDGGNDTLLGGAGTDNLWGGAGNDRLTGGAGADNLFGEGGDDTYTFELGDSPADGLYIDAVFGGGGNDTIEFGAGVTRDSILLARGADGQLRLAYSAEDRIYIEGGFTGAIQTLRFADGSTVSLAQLIGEQIDVPLSFNLTAAGGSAYGGASSDQINATGGGSTLSGGRGDDTLTATGGNNVYLYNLGDGIDTLQDLSPKTDLNGNLQPNTLRFGNGIAQKDLQLVFQPYTSYNGQEQYLIRFRSSPGDEIRVSPFVSGDVAQTPGIDRFEFADGQTLTWAELVQRGFDIVGNGNPLQQQYGTSANDRFAMAASNDLLKGGDGADTYWLSPGGGWDEVDNSEAGQPGTDVVQVAAGLSAINVGIQRAGDDMVILLSASGDRLRIRNHYTGAPIDGLRFDDGTYWDRATLEARASLPLPTGGNDSISLTTGDDVFDALAGDDVIDGLGGADVLYGNVGNDTLIGGEGDDVLDGGDDSDSLSGEMGDDEIVGGLGNDQLSGGPGSDVYRFARGEGYDTILSPDQTPNKVDAIVFGPGIALQDIALRRVASYMQDDLEIRVLNVHQVNDNKILVKYFFMFFDHFYKIEEIRFDDGSKITLDEIKTRLLQPTDGQDFLYGYETDDTIQGLGGDDRIDGDIGNDALIGGDGADYLYGNAGNDILEGGVGDDVLMGDGFGYLRNAYYSPIPGNDTLIGGAGNDRLEGGGANDVYWFGRGQGADWIYEGDGTANGGVDEIRLDAGIGEAAVSLIRTSDGTGADDLALVLDSGGEQLRIEDYFDATQDRRVERIVFADGPVWNAADIAARIVSLAGTPNTMTGTAGNDTFQVDHPQDQVVEAAGQGSDTIQSSVGYMLPENVENLTLTGVLNIDGKGNSLDNVLRGNDGNNRLDGYGGSDQLFGGRGDDVYVAGSIGALYGYGAQVVELAGEGNDTVVASYRDGCTLPDNVENLSFIVNAYYVTGQNVRLFGNTLDNTLSVGGNFATASRTVEIDGGAGADTLIGGSSNDIFILDNPGDRVIENATYANGSQISVDTVKAGFDYVLGANLENLILTGSAAVSGTGNAFNNALDGSQNAAANVLAGGIGDDTYILGVGDAAVELAGEGSDTVVLTFGAVGDTYSLTGYENIEGLKLSEVLGASNLLGGEANETLTGNNEANRIQGGSGNDVLYDAASRTAVQTFGAVDTLEGGDGNDRLVSWGGADIFDGGTGNDTLESYGATYRFAGAFGDDVVRNSSTAGYAVFSDLSVWQVQLERQGNNLVMRGPAGTGTVTVENHFASSSNSLAQIGFADGISLSNAQIAIRAAQGNAMTEGDDVVVGTSGADNFALLGGNDVAWGSAGDDTITAGAGEDWLYGGDGADRLAGGNGTGYLYGDAGDDVLEAGAGTVIMRGGEGADTFLWGLGDGADYIGAAENPSGTQWTDTLQLGPGITPEMVDVLRPYSGSSELELRIRNTSDKLTLAGFFYEYQDRCEIDLVRFDNGISWTRADLISRSSDKFGTDGADTLDGDSADNRLYGFAGNDTLNGLAGNDLLDGGTGADTMRGNEGDDTYVVDATGDIVTESANQGIDTVQSSITWTLGSNLEKLTLIGTAAINGTGNSLANTITGNSAANTLSGGSGADALIGGAGNDTYVVDNAGDVVTELAGEGTDLVQSSVSHTLAANVENLTLTGTSALNGTGNALANALTGNSAINTLTGGVGDDRLDGKSGADKLFGGLGNDTYVVDNSSDAITENAGEGTDTVESSRTWTLGNNLENLTLTGTSAINGTGNSLDNMLIGNSKVNTLKGGLGNDTYFVGSGDIVTESASQGTDIVSSGVTWILGSNLEVLTLTGTSAINGTGNTLSNLLRGNSAANTLTGGTGIDLLEGGLGNDTLSDSTASERGFFNGGAGTDTLTGGAGAELFIGGSGNDTLNTGAGADVVVFNLGDGQDAVTSATGQDNTLSLGGGIRYADVTLSKSGANLVVGIGASDRITLNNWYAATPVKSVLKLQMIAEAMADFDDNGADPLRDDRIESFDFAGLAGAFDAALVANPGLTSWAITNALTAFHLSGSDTEALGGDLAYQYGRYGNLANVGLTGAQNVLGNAQFGAQAQALQSPVGLQEGVVRLS